MDLIERYLAAIRRNLPADKASDVTAELREDVTEDPRVVGVEEVGRGIFIASGCPPDLLLQLPVCHVLL